MEATGFVATHEPSGFREIWEEFLVMESLCYLDSKGLSFRDINAISCVL
jgi:hypothetical protein